MYFFILGHSPNLSIAEIVSRINTNLTTDNTNIHEICDRFIKIHEISREVLILETTEQIDLLELEQQLGGTIKIGRVVSSISANLVVNSAKVIGEIGSRLGEYSRDHKKVYFGFSVYQLDEEAKIDQLESQIKRLALEIKRILKKQNISSRWVSAKERALSSVIVRKNHLLNQGAEFCFLAGRDRVYFGQTSACQAFEEYEFYDFGRPKRSIEKGMLPPKLAKIMINLAQIKKDSTLLDPFCGSGTILQEAARLGYQKIYGTDLSDEAVRSSQMNIDWFLERLKNKVQNINLQIKIQKQDVKNISQMIPLKSVDAVVTEPDLGPIKPKQGELAKTIKQLSDLYLSAFQEFQKILKPDGKVVIIWPIFNFGGRRHFLLILDNLVRQGWRVVNPIANIGEGQGGVQISERQSFIYTRPGQKVEREIFIFHLSKA